ncbi:MAG: hypothetical protein GKR87_11650 [Kiritimatiellae bacterium]|nr:hypothetical protein [Kiritimatiellia bacterium]
MKKITQIAAVFILLIQVASANPTPELDYQEKILINDLPFRRNGFFKFAISDLTSTTNYWSHDGTLSGEPIGFMTNRIFNGTFSTTLGASPMIPIDPDIFSNGNELYLRIWFSSATSGTYSEMLPAQKIVSSAYAMNADQIDGLDASELLVNAVSLNGTSLEIVDAGGTHIVDLSSLFNNVDTNSTNELITSINLNSNNVLEIIDGGSTNVVDLSSLGNTLGSSSVLSGFTNLTCDGFINCDLTFSVDFNPPFSQTPIVTLSA